DVVAFLRLREELLRRALRRDVGLGARGEDLAGLVLSRLHVRLVERVDVEDRAGDRDRELPAEELLRELVLAREPHVLRLTVGPVGRLTGRRDQSLALLAGGLRDQLLRPEAESCVALGDADLVATFAP